MTGKTKDAGWQVGARRTLRLELAEAWALLTSEPWLRRWSGLDALDHNDPALRSLIAQRHASPDTALPGIAAGAARCDRHHDRLPRGTAAR